MERTLELTLKLSENSARVEFYEPECGDFRAYNIDMNASKEEREQNVRKLGEEIYDWLLLMADEEHDEEREDD